MDLFKERLKKVGEKILAFLTVIIVIGAFLYLSVLAPVSVMHAISNILAVFVVFILGVGFLCLIGQFIHWLFIEPFRKGN